MKHPLLFTCLMIFGIINAQIPNYYDDVNINLTGQALKSELSTKITNTQFINLSYTPGIWEAIKQVDLDPTNNNNVVLIYGFDDNDQDLSNDRTRNKNLNGGGVTEWNREHVYPKSLGNPNLGTTGAGADIHHLRAADVTWNAKRSNRKFADGSGNSGITPQGYWYPGDEYKGDVARMMMFMYLRYGNRCLGTAVGIGNPVNSDNGMIDLFLQWNVEDPVSYFELNRNNLIEGIQGNRNPFIDNPAFATAIWNGTPAEDRFGSSGGSTNNLCSSTINSYPYQESFENGLGNWVQANSGDDFDWTIKTGATPSSNTGPGSAFSGSDYLFMESSAPNYSTKRSILYGPCYNLPSSGISSFLFNYHMYGASTMGALSVQLSLDGLEWTTIWSKSGNQGNSWNSAQIDLSNYNGQSVQLRFNGLTGTTWQGDMAIDNIKLTNVDQSLPAVSDINMRITFDNYPEETSWEIRDSNNQFATSGNNYGGRAPGSTINISKTLNDGCYTLIVRDSYGDGMCCSYGNGSYTLTNSTNNTIIASGGSFGSSQSTSFCITNGKLSVNGVSQTNDSIENSSLITIYPNPAKEYLIIGSSIKEQSFDILNTLGQRVLIGKRAGEKVDIRNLDPGIYFIRLYNKKGYVVKQFTKI